MKVNMEEILPWGSDVVERVGDDWMMDEHEKRKVGQKVKEVQGWNVPQLP